MPNPPGADGDNEWIELYNGGCDEVDLAGYAVEAGASKYVKIFTFPAGAKLEPGKYAVMGGKGVVFADYKAAAALNLGNASSSSDAVRLLDSQGTVVDTVIYGSPNTDNWVDDTGAVAASLAPEPTSTQTLARLPNGSDTDACGVDFVATHALTPGATNQ